MMLIDVAKAMTPSAIGFGLMVYGMVMSLMFDNMALAMMVPILFGAILTLHANLSRSGTLGHTFSIIAVSLILPMMVIVSALKVSNWLGASFVLDADSKSNMLSIFGNMFVTILLLALATAGFKIMWDDIAKSLTRRGHAWAADVPVQLPVYAVMLLSITGLVIAAAL